MIIYYNSTYNPLLQIAYNSTQITKMALNYTTIFKLYYYAISNYTFSNISIYVGYSSANNYYMPSTTVVD